MADLTTEQQRFVVVRLACQFKPSEIQAEFKEQFPGFGVTDRQISHYNPYGAGAVFLAKKWKDLYKETASRYMEEISSIPIRDQRYRYLRLQRLLDDPTFGESPKWVLKTIELAEKMDGHHFERGTDGETHDPNAIPQALQEAVEKIYPDRPSAPISTEEVYGSNTALETR